MQRKYLSPEVWDDVRKDGLVPVPLIKYKDKTAVSDEYHIEIFGAKGGGGLYSGNIAVVEDGKITGEFIYSHKYTDEDFLKWTLVTKNLDDYLRHSSFDKGV